MTSELWLKIVDVGAAQTASDKHRLALRWCVAGETGSTEIDFVSPLTADTQALAERHVREFRSWRAADRERAQTAEWALLNLGRALGNALVDPQYRLLTCCERLEGKNLAELRVAVLSDHGAIMALPWELLILPDSPYVLSAASAAFVRGPTTARPFEEPARALGLGAGQPLCYLQLAGSRAPTAWHALRFPEDVLQHGIGTSPDALARPWHIVQLAAELLQDDAGLQARLCDGTVLAAHELVERVAATDCELLIFEPSDGAELAPALADSALRAGISNVLTVAPSSARGWPSTWAETLLDQLCAGQGLQRALVEVRKQLQRELLAARAAEVGRPHAADHGHSLRHYSLRDVIFFAAAQPRAELAASERYRALRQKLFGFDAERLPARAADVGDAAALRLLRELQAHRRVQALAAPGGGLSHALHRAALLACASGGVERAYYWDLAREAFSVADVVEMVAGTRGQADPAQVQESEVLAPLASQPELFVFDHVDAPGREGRQEHVAQLAALSQRIADAGGLCVLATHTPLMAAELHRLQLPAPSEAECWALVQHSAPERLALGDGLAELVEQLREVPLLLLRALSKCSTQEELQALVTEARQRYGEGSERLERFHALRWQAQPPYVQRLLQSWLPLEGLYLQVLMLAVDQPGGEPTDLGRALWRRLEAPADLRCAELISQLQASGFAAAAGAGTSLDPAAVRFLRAQTASEDLGPLLARLVCAGVCRLLERRNQATPEVLIQHILRQRAPLRLQIERALSSGEHISSVRAFLRLHDLMLQAQLQHEAAEWAGNLLSLAGPALCTHLDAQRAIAWLSLALRAKLQPLSAAVEQGARYWADVIAEGKLGQDATSQALFPLVVSFLEKLHDQTGDLAAYREVARAAVAYYRAKADLPNLVGQLCALAAAEHVLQDAAQRDRVEHELINELTYGDSPAAALLRQQTLARVAGMRLRRADADAASAVIDLLEAEWRGDALNTLAVMLRGELAVFRARWDLAAASFCTLWAAAMSGTRGIDVDAVARRLAQLEERLGAERFAALFTEHAGAVPSPEALRGLTSAA